MTGDEGIIWRLNAAKPLASTLEDGVIAHNRRTGLTANVIELHADDLNGAHLVVAGVEVVPVIDRLKGEAFIGVRMGRQ